jgi:hypothetical protein
MVEEATKAVDAWIENHQQNGMDPYDGLIHLQGVGAEVEELVKKKVLVPRGEMTRIKTLELLMICRLAAIGTVSVVTRLLSTGALEESTVILKRKGEGNATDDPA